MGSAAVAMTVVGLGLPTSSAFAEAGPCPGTDDPTTLTHGLSADCQLSATWVVEPGWTIDGNGHTITVAPGFSGPVIESTAGTTGVTAPSMSVKHVAIDATGSSGHIAGVLFDGAQGSVTGVTISGVNQNTVGDNGYGVEADNSVGATGVQVRVDQATTITGYQRAAIYAHGDLKLTVLRAVVGSPHAISGQGVAGVLVTDGAHGSIKESSIDLSDTEPATSSAFGAGVEIAKDSSASPRRVEVKRNVFTGTDADFGISVTNPAQAAKMTAAIDCNLFQRSDSSADPYGVGVGQWENAPKTNVQVTDSTFVGWKHLTGTISGGTVIAGPPNDVRTSTSTCVPGAPTHVVAAGGNRRSEVTWQPGTPLDYAPLTDVQVKAKATGHPAITKTVPADATSTVLTGLNNKLSYVVTVTARSNGGAASGTTFLARTKLSLTAKPGVIHRGGSSKLHGTLSSADPKAHLGKRKVTLWAKPKGGAWSRIATLRTSAKGAFAHTVKPRRTTAYKVVYAGRPDLASSHKTTVRVKH
jgi:hypothetical protein